MMLPSSAKTSANASVGRRWPKNNFDHWALAASCEIHSRKAALRSREGAALQTRHPEYATSAYRVVHATGKTLSGGVKPGLRRSRYHPSRLLRQWPSQIPRVREENPFLGST